MGGVFGCGLVGGWRVCACGWGECWCVLVGVSVVVVSDAHVFWPLSCFVCFVCFVCLVNNGGVVVWRGLVCLFGFVVLVACRLLFWCVCCFGWQVARVVDSSGWVSCVVCVFGFVWLLGCCFVLLVCARGRVFVCGVCECWVCLAKVVVWVVGVLLGVVVRLRGWVVRLLAVVWVLGLMWGCGCLC